jgi:DNA primase
MNSWGKKIYLPVKTEVLADLIQSGGAPYRENSVSYIFTCPRCQKANKLYLRKGDGRFVCWVCKETEGFQGRPEFALTELLGVPLKELKSKLYGTEDPQATIYLEFRVKDFFADDDEVDLDADELQWVLWPLDCYEIGHRFAAKGLAYLEGRGVSAEMAARYGLRYCPPQQRVMFPIESGGTLYGWQGRKVGPTEFVDEETGETTSIPKVTTLKGVRKESTLMFADRLRDSEHAVVCEGPMDGLKADLCGGNVVTMGKAVSRQQIALLHNAGIRKVYLALDPDAANEIMRLVREFSDLEVYDMRAPEPFKDLGEMTPGDVLEVFRRARRITAANLVTYVERDFDRLLLLKRREALRSERAQHRRSGRRRA